MPKAGQSFSMSFIHLVTGVLLSSPLMPSINSSILGNLSTYHSNLFVCLWKIPSFRTNMLLFVFYLLQPFSLILPSLTSSRLTTFLLQLTIPQREEIIVCYSFEIFQHFFSLFVASLQNFLRSFSFAALAMYCLSIFILPFNFRTLLFSPHPLPVYAH